MNGYNSTSYTLAPLAFDAFTKPTIIPILSQMDWTINTSCNQITLPANNHKIQYEWRTFEQLTGKEIYDMLQLRQQVFVVEQNCPYLDADGLDIQAHHLLAWSVEQEHLRLAGYLRVILPGVKFPEPAIGRVVTHQPKRRIGVAREMMQHTLRFIDTAYPSQGARISAQCYLEKFYLELGFRTVSEPYDEDGIPHVEMLYSTRATAGHVHGVVQK